MIAAPLMQLRGQELTVSRQELPELGEGEWWAHELVGCIVRDGGHEVGEVTDLLELPSCEVLEVRRSDAPGPLLVPLVRDAVRSVDAQRRTIDIELGFPGGRSRGGRRGRGAAVRIDVFTLFPQWFEWFRGQRHVANVLAAGSTLEWSNIREHTPLPAGQVDDTPFGGGCRDGVAGGRPGQRPAGPLRGGPRASCASAGG